MPAFHPYVTYGDLVSRYGMPAAYGLLLEIERLAQISTAHDGLTEDARLQKALDALNDIDFSAAADDRCIA